MTDAQKTTAKQIIQEYDDLFYEKPIIVNMGDREIILKINTILKNDLLSSKLMLITALKI